MKNKSILALVIFTAVFFSCKKASDNSAATEKESLLNLSAPNGIRIAPNTDGLKSLLASTVNRKFQADNLEYSITGINYSVTKSNGVIADVSFKTKDGQVSNVILMKGVKEKITSTGDVKVVIDDSYMRQYSVEESLTSIHKYSCSGPECCMVHALEHPDGSVDVDCSCQGCTMTIE